MPYIYKGMMAGVMGALVLSAYLLLNIETGWMPALDFVSLAGNLTGTGTTGGWVIHFLVGAMLGGLFAWLDPDLPGDSLRQRGMILAGLAWLLMMFLLMPLAGYGVFGLNQSVLLPVGALVLHMIFGLIMGGTYGWLILQALPLRYRHGRKRTPAIAPPDEFSVQLPKPTVSESARAQAEPEVYVPPTVEVVRPSVVPLVPGAKAPVVKIARQKLAARRPTNGAPAANADRKSKVGPLNGGSGLAAKSTTNGSSDQRRPGG
ncbi:MAG TPA: DUF6789 family protein [Xanthobacteraceae bacterium]